MKKILKSKIFWAIIVLLIIGGYFGYKFLFPAKATEYVTQDVYMGDIVQTVSATGKVKSASELMLNFKNSAKISSISVKVGDKVKKDQILAQQKSNDLLANVDKARANLMQAQANLSKLKAGAVSQDIAVYEVAVQKAMTDLENAKNDLSSTKSTYSQAVENKRNTLLVGIKDSLSKANVSIQKMNDTLNFEGNTNNMIVNDPNLYNTVTDGRDQSKQSLTKAENDYNIASASSDIALTNTAYDSAEATLLLLSKTLNNFSKLLDAVIVTPTLTRTELDGLKVTINTEWSLTNAGITAVQTGKQNLDDARLSYTTKVESAENTVKTYERTLAKYQADLNYKKAPARPEDLRLYEAQVLSAQADLSLALDRLDETVIRAPIDGQITSIDGEVGEVSSMSAPLVKMLTNNNYEVEVDIPESDIAKISVGDKTEITLDAFTSDDIFIGVITKIDPAETTIQDVIYYKVTVAFESEQPLPVKEMTAKIKPGMTANVTVNTAMAQNVMIIPTRAVKEEGQEKYVEILENNLPVKKIVSLGLKGDEGKVEVMSGLSVGQKVITFVRTK